MLFTAVPSLFLTEPPPLSHFTSNPPRRRVKAIAEHNFEELQLFQGEYSATQDSSTEQEFGPFCADEELLPEATSLKDFHTALSYDEATAETTPVFDGYVKVEKLEASHVSTQTDCDFFLENYNQVVEKNVDLENELTKWATKFKSLMASMKYLEDKVQRLTLSSNRATTED